MSSLGLPSRWATTLALACLGWATPATGQSRVAVEQERREYAQWLRDAPLSPSRAVGVFPLGNGLTLGPASAAVPLAGVAAARLVERGGRVVLQQGDSSRTLALGRALGLGTWRLVPSGAPGRIMVTVFAAELRKGKQPAWFPYDPSAVHRVTLVPPPAPASLRLLAPDGTEVEASEAGSVTLQLGGRQASLRVRRLPGASAEESELELFFRDGTSGRGSYPAGRFVALIPEGGDRYLLDFNRARNPFCAYNTAYPCPAPWRGNTLPVAVRAGERYQGGGFEPPPQE